MNICSILGAGVLCIAMIWACITMIWMMFCAWEHFKVMDIVKRGFLLTNILDRTNLLFVDLLYTIAMASVFIFGIGWNEFCFSVIMMSVAAFVYKTIPNEKCLAFLLCGNSVTMQIKNLVGFVLLFVLVSYSSSLFIGVIVMESMIQHILYACKQKLKYAGLLQICMILIVVLHPSCVNLVISMRNPYNYSQFNVRQLEKSYNWAAFQSFALRFFAQSYKDIADSRILIICATLFWARLCVLSTYLSVLVYRNNAEPPHYCSN